MKTKHTSSVFSTKNGNSYTYSEKNKSFLYCHPVIREIDICYNAYKNNTDKLKDEVKSKFPNEDISYYLNKYLFLKNKNYFSKKPEVNLKGRISSQLIKSVLANSSLLTFEVTDRCNLKCKYCGYGEFYKVDRLFGKFLEFT